MLILQAKIKSWLLVTGSIDAVWVWGFFPWQSTNISCALIFITGFDGSYITKSYDLLPINLRRYNISCCVVVPHDKQLPCKQRPS